MITLGAFAGTNVGGVIHQRGTTDEQAGTFMHELGHTLGLRHGGGDGENCKPNYLSIMSYSRQFAGARSRTGGWITGGPARRPERERAERRRRAGRNPSLLPLLPFFPLADQVAFGPNSWSVATATSATINWEKSLALPALAEREREPQRRAGRVHRRGQDRARGLQRLGKPRLPGFDRARFRGRRAQ